MPSAPLRAFVLNQIAFEDLGSLQPVLERRAFTIETADVSTALFPLPQAQSCDLLVVLGGPIGVYDLQDYPFLKDEIVSIRQRLAACKPTLGICLGAQLMAAALGARVYPGTRGAEIGWSPLLPGDPKAIPEWFAPLLENDLSVFHWHGDTFDHPSEAKTLAGTELYENQAFAVGKHALALQFHPEVTAIGLERWYVGHASELRTRGIDVQNLRAAGQKYAPALEKAADHFWTLWLDHIL